MGLVSEKVANFTFGRARRWKFLGERGQGRYFLFAGAPLSQYRASDVPLAPNETIPPKCPNHD